MCLHVQCTIHWQWSANDFNAFLSILSTIDIETNLTDWNTNLHCQLSILKYANKKCRKSQGQTSGGYETAAGGKGSDFNN